VNLKIKRVLQINNQTNESGEKNAVFLLGFVFA
jgi:hypothetical protein